MNTKTLAALLLGAALVTPALAQDAVSANNGNSATAQTAPAAAPTTPVDSSIAKPADNMPATNTASTDAKPADAMAQPAAPTSTAAAAPSQPANTQMAMNTTGDASALSSVPDTQKKYSRANRAKDFKSEAETTKALNQKGNELAGGTAQ